MARLLHTSADVTGYRWQAFIRIEIIADTFQISALQVGSRALLDTVARGIMVLRQHAGCEE